MANKFPRRTNKAPQHHQDRKHLLKPKSLRQKLDRKFSREKAYQLDRGALNLFSPD